MKGLLIKDLIASWKSIISCSLIMIFTMVMTKLLVLDKYDLSAIFLIIVLCGSMITYMIISDDDKSGFLKYMKILPVKRKLVVMEKIIMSLLTMGIFSTVGLIGIYVTHSFSTNNLWKIVYLVLPIGMAICAILLSLVIIFGTEKALLIILVSLPILTIGIGGLLGYIDSKYFIGVYMYLHRNIILVSCIAVYVISYLISANNYDLKRR